MTASSTNAARDFIGRIVTLTIDQPYGSTHPEHGYMYYANYGHAADVLTADGAPLTAYYLGEHVPLETVTGRCIAIIERSHDGTAALIVAPADMDLSPRAIAAAVAFQEINGTVITRA